MLYGKSTVDRVTVPGFNIPMAALSGLAQWE